MDDDPGVARTRLESIDVVRGVIMVIMALDHTRDFFGVPGASPTNLATASVALFLTRWITNVCAPVFFLLTGTGAWLSLRSRSTGELSRFLLTRGLWLVVLELVLVRCFVYQFNVDYRVTMLLVLWALGWAMVALSALVWLPTPLVTAIGLGMIAGHNLLDAASRTGPLWTVLHAQGFVLNTPQHVVFVAYPLVPWIGVTAAGFGLAQIFAWDGERRRRWLIGAAVTMSASFVLLRALNLYGDPSRWRDQATPLFTVLSFINTTKYPPSLLFLLMTLAPVMLLLAALERGTPRLLRPARVLGAVPLFYYVLHFLFIHLLAVAVCYLRYGTAHWMFESPDLTRYPFSAPPGWGYPLPVVYGVWVGIVAMTYPLCAWYAGLRRRWPGGWLSYL